MGNCRSATASSVSSGNRKLTLAILGLDNAGKTVTANGLQGAMVTDVAPTIGFSSLTFTYERHDIVLYDLGGGANIRDIWHKYYADVYGFVFVIDASNDARMDECRRVLASFLDNHLVRGKPILLLANKQDVEGALDEEDVCDRLELEELVNRYKSPCRVEPCSALGQNGKKIDTSIQVGFHWLIKFIDHKWEELSLRINNDLAEKAELEKEEKLERMKRVQRSRELREQEERSQGQLRDDKDLDEPDGGNPFKPIDEHFKKSSKKKGGRKKRAAKKSQLSDDVEDSKNSHSQRSMKSKEINSYYPDRENFAEDPQELDSDWRRSLHTTDRNLPPLDRYSHPVDRERDLRPVDRERRSPRTDRDGSSHFEETDRISRSSDRHSPRMDRERNSHFEETDRISQSPDRHSHHAELSSRQGRSARYADSDIDGHGEDGRVPYEPLTRTERTRNSPRSKHDEPEQLDRPVHATASQGDILTPAVQRLEPIETVSVVSERKKKKVPTATLR